MKTPKLLTVLHEGTPTGAPIAGVRSAAIIKSLGFDSYIFCASKPSDEFLSFLSGAAPGVKVVNEFNLGQFDAYICHSAACSEIVSQLTYAERKVAWWIHEDSHFFDVISSSQINHCLSRATALVFTSSHCAYRTFGSWVWQRNGYGIHIIPNFTEQTTLNRSKFQTPVIAHVATLSRRKGTDIVIQLAHITQEMGWKFHLIGRVIDHDLFLNLPQNITLHGETHPLKVNGELDSCSHLFHPTRLDNQPLVIIEAIARGLNVISSPLPSIQAYANNTHGVHCFREDSTTWSNLIEKFRSTLNMKTNLPGAMTLDHHKSLLKNLLLDITNPS